MTDPATIAAAYARDGFVVVEDIFTRDDVARIKAECRRVLDEAIAADPKNGVAQHGVLVGITARSALMKAVNADPRIVEPLRAIMGPDIEFLSDKLVYKSSDMGFGSPWHQDWHYWHGQNKVSVWIALDDATPENGCLKMLPGTHHRAVTMTGKSGDGKGFDFRMDPKDIDESKVAVIRAKAGTAVIFHDLALHASFPNTSGADRWALISTYRSAAAPDFAYGWASARFMVAGENRVPAAGQEA
jgi:ectoine hydroxylase-related dioxygenase (phytanoyl-CoA dioxygenase family)